MHPPNTAANQCRVRISRSLTMNAVKLGTFVNLAFAPRSPFSANRRNEESTGAAICAYFNYRRELWVNCIEDADRTENSRFSFHIEFYQQKLPNQT